MAKVFGTKKNDSLIGTSGDDWIKGDNGNDILNGGAGNDEIDGGNGNDVIIGGLGADILSGGNGADNFKFEDTVDTGNVIRDFEVGIDHIDLTALGVTPSSVSWSYNGHDTTVSVNTDNNTDNGAEVTITLNNVSSLSASDFFIV